MCTKYCLRGLSLPRKSGLMLTLTIPTWPQLFTVDVKQQHININNNLEYSYPLIMFFWVYLYCLLSTCVRSAMLHASETWPVTKPCLQHLQRNDRAMIRQICNVKPQDTATIRSIELLARLGIEDLDPYWKKEGSACIDMWNAPMMQSRQPLTYRLMESMGLGGPRWLGSSWQRGITESGSSQLSTPMTETPGDLVWDLPCVQQASCLEGGPLLWIWPLYLHVNQKSDDDDDDDDTTMRGNHYYERDSKFFPIATFIQPQDGSSFPL